MRIEDLLGEDDLPAQLQEPMLSSFDITLGLLAGPDFDPSLPLFSGILSAFVPGDFDELPNPDLVITTIPEPAMPALAFAGLVSLMLRRFATLCYPRNPALCSAGAIQSIARRGASP
jgi:hypothetical protein